MNVELRKFKSYPRLSEETTAFNAELWIDGKKAGDAENSGKGEPNRLSFADRSVEQSFYAYCLALPPEKSKWGEFKMNADFFVSLLVEKANHAFWLAKQSKKAILFKMPGDSEDTYRKQPFIAGRRVEAEQHIRKTYPTAILVGV